MIETGKYINIKHVLPVYLKYIKIKIEYDQVIYLSC